MEDKILKLFRVKSLSEAIFIIFLFFLVSTITIVGYISFHQRYIHFTFESMNEDEVFFTKVGDKTLFIYKDIDALSSRPRVHYKVKDENSTFLYGGSITLGEFELYPNGIIFEEKNGTIEYVDQYIKPTMHIELPKSHNDAIQKP